MTIPVDAILVPQGAEYKSVCKGLKYTKSQLPVFPIPMGTAALTQYLEKWQQAGHIANCSQPKVLLMGLCGSLSPQYAVGDVVLYESCVYSQSQRKDICDRELTDWVDHKLKERVYRVKALTSDHLIYSATEKSNLGQVYAADVVDMEGFAALEILSQFGVAVAMLRVVSDDIHHDIPDLTAALNKNGSLETLPLAIALLRQPLAAMRLIRGAMRGLQVLQKVTTLLFSDDYFTPFSSLPTDYSCQDLAQRRILLRRSKLRAAFPQGRRKEDK